MTLPRVHLPPRDLYVITCMNSGCEKPTVLPLPIQDDSSPNPVLWPKDGKPRNFLCSKCNHVYEYTSAPPRPGEKLLLDEASVDDTVYRIGAICGDQSCESPVYILLTAPSWQKPKVTKHERLSKGILGTVRCSRGHTSTPVIPPSADVRVDQDWK
jgi:hypothetical protein